MPQAAFGVMDCLPEFIDAKTYTGWAKKESCNRPNFVVYTGIGLHTV